VAICEGAISELVRVWADSKQLDLTAGSYTALSGTEEQLPDTFMSSFAAAGQTPAYRGTAYAVIQGFPAREFRQSHSELYLRGAQDTRKSPSTWKIKSRDITTHSRCR